LNCVETEWVGTHPTNSQRKNSRTERSSLDSTGISTKLLGKQMVGTKNVAAISHICSVKAY